MRLTTPLRPCGNERFSEIFTSLEPTAVTNRIVFRTAEIDKDIQDLIDILIRIKVEGN